MRVNCAMVALRSDVAPEKAAPKACACSTETGPPYSAVKLSDSASKSEASHSPRSGLDVHVFGEQVKEFASLFDDAGHFIQRYAGHPAIQFNPNAQACHLINPGRPRRKRLRRAEGR